MIENIILIGGGGHCKSCIDVIEMENRFNIVGIVSKPERLHQKVSSYEIIACDKDIPNLVNDYKLFLITIGQIKNVDTRIEKFNLLVNLGGQFPVIISPLAHVSKHASIGDGTIIMHNVVVNAGATIGENCIINTGAIIEHDVVVGDHCHISTGAIINGGTIVREKTFFGSNSVTKEYIEIGESSVIGAGLRVIKSVKSKRFLK